MLSFLRDHNLPWTGLVRALLVGVAIAAVPASAVLYDWHQVTLARELAAKVAEAAAVAGAASFEDARRVARRLADDMAPQRFTLELLTGIIDPKAQPPAFKETSEAPDVVRITASGKARLSFGRYIGLASWPVSATADAERTGLAAIAVRSQANPPLMSLASGLERQLVGDSWTFTVDERQALAAAAINLRSVIGAIRDHVPEAASSLADARIAVGELFGIVAELAGRPENMTPQTARAATTLSRLSQAAEPGYEIRLGSVFGFADGFDPLDNNLPPQALDVRALDFVQSVMRARLIEHPVAFDLDRPVDGISALSLKVSAQAGSEDADAASIRIGSNDSVLRTLPIRVAVRVRLGGIAIGEVREFVLPWEVTVNAGEAAISAITCTGPFSNVEVRGQPVRVVASVYRPSGEKGTAASGFVPLLNAEGLTVWAKGSVGFANDPPVSTTIPANASGSEVFRLRAPIDLGNRLEKLANESVIVVSVDPQRGMTEGGVRSEISQAIKDRLGALTDIFLSAYSVFGITPGQLEVAVSAASCAYARPVASR